MAAHALTTTPTLSRPSLKERAASLRQALTRRAKPTPDQPDPHVGLRADLIQAHAAMDAARSVFVPEGDIETPEYRAAHALERHLHGLVSTVLRLPPPFTLDGLAVVALAAAFHAEGSLKGQGNDDNASELAAVLKALVSNLDVGLPASFLGFGDESDFAERERATMARPWALPA